MARQFKNPVPQGSTQVQEEAASDPSNAGSKENLSNVFGIANE